MEVRAAAGDPAAPVAGGFRKSPPNALGIPWSSTGRTTTRTRAGTSPGPPRRRGGGSAIRGGDYVGAGPRRPETPAERDARRSAQMFDYESPILDN